MGPPDCNGGEWFDFEPKIDASLLSPLLNFNGSWETPRPVRTLCEHQKEVCVGILCWKKLCCVEVISLVVVCTCVCIVCGPESAMGHVEEESGAKVELGRGAAD